MASIDTSAIENFADLDADALREFISNFTYEDNAEALAAAQEEAKANKAATDKATKQAADFKRQLKAAQDSLANAQTEGENKLNEANTAAESRIADLEEQVKDFQRDKTIAEHTAKFIGLGYSAELAAETATAFADGDTAKVFENQQKFIEEHDKALKSASVQKPVKPGKGNPDPDGKKVKTREDIQKMSPADRIAYYNAHKDEYQQAYQPE